MNPNFPDGLLEVLDYRHIFAKVISNLSRLLWGKYKPYPSISRMPKIERIASREPNGQLSPHRALDGEGIAPRIKGVRNFIGKCGPNAG